jgi:acyl carrier protein
VTAVKVLQARAGQRRLVDETEPSTYIPAGVTNSALTERLLTLLADATGSARQRLEPTASRGNTPGWDSLASLGFIAAVEEEFHVSILTAEAMEIRSVKDMEELLQRKGAGG